MMNILDKNILKIQDKRSTKYFFKRYFLDDTFAFSLYTRLCILHIVIIVRLLMFSGVCRRRLSSVVRRRL